MRSKVLKLLAGVSLLSLTALGAVPAGASPANIVQNGSFLNGTHSPGSFVDLNPTSGTQISDWTVSSGTVDWIGSYWTTPNNGYSVDLNGINPGAISQTLSTVPGATYVVSFSLAGNFDNIYYSEYTNLSSQTTKSTTVSATGNPSGNYAATYFSGWGHSSMGWQTETYQFTATGNSTTLTFAGDPTAGGWGPVISAVSAYELVASSGAQCKDGGWQMYSNPTTLQPFVNQGMCVSYFATAGDVPIGSANSH